MTPTPSRISVVVDSGPIRKDAIATPGVTIAPTERSRWPASSALVCAHRHHGQGDGEEEDVGDVPLVHEPGEPRLRVPEEQADQDQLQHHRHPQAEPDDLPPLVPVAGVAEDLADRAPGRVDVRACGHVVL